MFQIIFLWFAAKQINLLKFFLTRFLQTIKKICLKRWKVVILRLTTLIDCTLVDINDFKRGRSEKCYSKWFKSKKATSNPKK